MWRFAAYGGGILVVLINAAANLAMAMPAPVFYRYSREPIDDLILGIEAEALKRV